MLKMNSPTKTQLIPKQNVSANGAAGQFQIDAHATVARRASLFRNSPTKKPVMPKDSLSANGATGQRLSDAQKRRARRATISESE
jgi:hypothetical protein